MTAMSYRHTMSYRYTQPMKSLLELWWIKSIIGILGVLFRFDSTLITLVVLLVTIDTVTGMRAAYRRGEPVTSMGMRMTIPKVIEFAIFITMATVFSNGFPNEFGWFDHWAIMYVAATEVKSITENLWPERAGAIMRKFNFFRSRQDAPEGEEEKVDGE